MRELVTLLLSVAVAWSSHGALGCLAAPREVIDPEEAKADPDFGIQGEYLGFGRLPEGKKDRIGAQVVALGGGRFDVYLLDGGLPGDGWSRGDLKLRIRAERNSEGAVVVTTTGWNGTIGEGKFRLQREGGEICELSRLERTSPTLGAKPPEGAVVLFDGTNLEWFPGGKFGPDQSLFSGVLSKPAFNSCQIHLEFRLTWMPEARGQARSNSGVYVHNCYEIQVLDSFGLEGQDNECGGIYSLKAPDVNMCLPPMVWQTYDIDFTAPKYDEQGNKVANARITVRHNGVVIHDNYELPRATPGGQPEGPGPRGIQLQGHGCHVQYRNIWVVPKQ
jgi:hypothetical protein